MRHWWTQKPHWLTALLMPLEYIYRAVICIRQWGYQIGLLKTHHASTPIVVVGNITVGGSGKTPFVITLAKALTTEGYKVGLISRGYRGKRQQDPQIVDNNSHPDQVGDEALLLKQLTGCPMVVGKQRIAAARMLLAHSPCDIIISDDGLQHYSMHRDLEIHMVDGIRRFGNQHCLPAGPLREPLNRLKSIPLHIATTHQQSHEHLMTLNPAPLYQINKPHEQLPLDHLPKTVHALCGIGHPERFFNQLRSLGCDVTPHTFPDHHRYTAKDINIPNADMIIMTEKDAVKCRQFVDDRHWCLPISGSLSNSSMKAILDHIHALTGHKTRDTAPMSYCAD